MGTDRKGSLARFASRVLVVAGLAAAIAGAGGRAEAAVEGVIYNPGTGHYYKWVATNGTWPAAKSGAEALGGYLATITSAAELSWVLQNMGIAQASAWLGGTDSVTEGTWAWVSGEPWSYTNWNSGEPNNVGDEDALAMYGNGTWNDAPMTYVFPSSPGGGYLVEWDLDPNPPPPPVLPADPTNLTAVLTAAGSIQLAWTDGSVNENAFRIERKDSGGSFATLTTRASNTTAHEDDSVAVNTTYTYRVRAENGVGPSAWSNEASATSSAFSPSPASPSHLLGIASGPDAVDVAWRDNSSGEIGFEVHRRTGAAPFAFVTFTAADATAFHDAGLRPDTAYDYRVRAVGTSRESGFVQASTVTPPTLTVETLRGDLKDSAKFAKDSIKVVASYEFLGGASDGTADPVAEGLSMRAGSDAAPVLLILQPGIEGWTSKGDVRTWKSPKGSVVKYKVQVNVVTRLVTISAKGLELAAPSANPVRIALGLGDDGGTDIREWPAQKKVGVFKLR